MVPKSSLLIFSGVAQWISQHTAYTGFAMMQVVAGTMQVAMQPKVCML
jgi:hypothetical protein